MRKQKCEIPETCELCEWHANSSCNTATTIWSALKAREWLLSAFNLQALFGILSLSRPFSFALSIALSYLPNNAFSPSQLQLQLSHSYCRSWSWSWKSATTIEMLMLLSDLPPLEVGSWLLVLTVLRIYRVSFSFLATFLKIMQIVEFCINLTKFWTRLI